MSGGRPLEAHILGGPPAPVKLRAGRVQGVRLRAVCQEVSNGRRSGPPGVPVGYSVPGFLSSLSLWRVAVASVDSGALLESPLGLLLLPRCLSPCSLWPRGGLRGPQGQASTTSWPLPPRFGVRRLDVHF